MTRSGKTALTLRSVRATERLLVWDFLRRDWPQENCETIDGLPALAARLQEVGAGPVRISYRANELSPDEFGAWARCAFAWLQFAPATIVAEELADVQHPGKAVRGWGELIRAGLGYGAEIYGITQRPQETDKSIYGNADILRVFRVAHDDDARYISRATGISQELITSLNELEYLEKRVGQADTELKKVTF